MNQSFSSNISSLRPCLEWIRTTLKSAFDQKNLKQIELASEEVFVNISHHAYKDLEGEVNVSLNTLSDRVEIKFADTGPPFNPLEAPQADITDELELRQVGGLGIHFIKSCMDDVLYERVGKSNCLTLVKFTHPFSQTT